MRFRGDVLLICSLALVVSAARGTAAAHDPAARAPASRPRARGVGQPERRLGLPLRQGRDRRARALVRGAARAVPAPDPGAVPLGLEAVGRRGRGRRRVVRADAAGAGSLAGQARVPRGGRLRLEDERLARRQGDRLAPGGLHALRVRAHGARQARRRSSAWSCAWTTRRTRSSWRASRDTGRPAACGRRSTWRRGPRSTWTRSSSTRASRASASSCACGSATRRPRAPRSSCGCPRARGRCAVAEAREAIAAGRARGPAHACRSGRARASGRSRTRYLYDATLTLGTASGQDRVKGYFGLREIGVAKLPGLGHPYVALNGTPVYLQMTLDQS